MAFVGMAPFGSLLAGGLAHYLGAPRTVMITGACCVLGAAWFTFELPGGAEGYAPDLCGDGNHPRSAGTGDRRACLRRRVSR